MSPDERSYSSGEMAVVFSVDKKTLFRWERKGRISPVPRDWRKHRRYTNKHIVEVQLITGEEPRWDLLPHGR